MDLMDVILVFYCIWCIITTILATVHSPSSLSSGFSQTDRLF